MSLCGWQDVKTQELSFPHFSRYPQWHLPEFWCKKTNKTISMMMIADSSLTRIFWGRLMSVIWSEYWPTENQSETVFGTTSAFWRSALQTDSSLSLSLSFLTLFCFIIFFFFLMGSLQIFCHLLHPPPPRKKKKRRRKEMLIMICQ